MKNETNFNTSKNVMSLTKKIIPYREITAYGKLALDKLPRNAIVPIIILTPTPQDAAESDIKKLYIFPSEAIVVEDFGFNSAIYKCKQAIDLCKHFGLDHNNVSSELRTEMLKENTGLKIESRFKKIKRLLLK